MRNLAVWTPRWLGKRWVATTLCFLGLHDDAWYVAQGRVAIPTRPAWPELPYNYGSRIIRYCGRCGSVR
jgi:hypothetical protein